MNEDWDQFPVAVEEPPVQDQTLSWDEFPEVVAPETETPPEAPSTQGRLASAANEALKGLGNVATGTLSGLSELPGFFARNLTPVGWLAKAGVEPAQKAIDIYTAPAQKMKEVAQSGEAFLEENLPTNPAYKEEYLASKVPAVLGQAAGQLGTALIPAKWLQLGAKGVQALGLSQAGLLGLKGGYDESDRLGIQDPVKRDIFATIFAGTEAGTEALGGFGGKSMSKALAGEIRDLLEGGALKTVAKTAAGEGAEEVLAKIPQDIASTVMRENEAEVDTINPTKADYWGNLAEAWGLGAVAGGLFGGVQATANRKTTANALAMRASVQDHELDLTTRKAAGEALTPEEESNLADLKSYDSRLSAWLESKGVDQASQQAGLVTAKAISSATRAGMPETAEALRAAAKAATDRKIEALRQKVVAQEEPESVETTEIPTDETLQPPQIIPPAQELQPPTGEVDAADAPIVQPDPVVGAESQPELTQSALTPEAEAIAQRVDSGGSAPAFISASLERVANDNGITVTGSMTPKDVVDALRSKRDAAAKAETTSTPSLEQQVEQEFRNRGAESAAGAIAPAIQRWAKAFSGVQFRPLNGSAGAVEGSTLVLDPDFIAESLESGSITPESVEAVLQEEVIHPAVDRATARMMERELGREVSLEEVQAQHAADWLALPENVRKESERLYRLAAIERGRRALKKESLTDQEIDQILSREQSSDVTRGVEFKRQVIQGRLFGVLTEEAQANRGFARWLRNFLSELLEAIRDVAARLTDPEARRKLDQLEQEVRSELAKLGVETVAQPEIARETPPISTERTAEGAADTESARQDALQAEERTPERVSEPQIAREAAEPLTIDQIVERLDASARVPNITQQQLQAEVQSLAGPRLKELAEALGYKASAQDIAQQLLAENKAQAAAKRADETQTVQEKAPVTDSGEISERPLTTEEKIVKRRGEGVDEAPEGMRPQDVEERYSAPEVVGTPKEQLAAILERFRRHASPTQEEGMDPSKATVDKRTYKKTGEQVEQYRKPLSPDEINRMGRTMLKISAQMSGDRFNKVFGQKVLAFIEDRGDLQGIPRDDTIQAWISRAILNNSNGIAHRLGLDPRQAYGPFQSATSRLGTGLSLASHGAVFDPLKDLAEETKGVTDKELKKRGIKDDLAFAESITKPTEEAQKEQVGSVQQDVAQWFEGALSSFGEKSQKMLSRLKEIMVRITELRQRKAAMGAQKAPEVVGASEPVTVEDIDAEIAALVEEADGILSQLFNTPKRKRKKKATPEEAEAEIKQAVAVAEELASQVSFTEWVKGGEQEGLPKFVDLVTENINPTGFNREAFMESLVQKFETVDKDLIEDVTNRVGDALDAKTEEVSGEAEKPDFDARAKYIIGLAIKKDATPNEEKERDALSEATKKRLKEEITSQQYMEALADLEIEPQTVFAMNRKVELDIQRRKAEKLQRKAKAELEKSKKEAEKEIDRLVGGLLGPKNPSEKTEFKKALEDYRAFEIDAAQLRSELLRLNVPEKTADNLLKHLQNDRDIIGWERSQLIRDNVQKARTAAIDRAVKSMAATKPKDAPKRTRFVKSLVEAAEAGVLDSQAVRDAFAEAYDLHGLTQERMETLADLLRRIEAMPDGAPKQTLLEMAYDVLNDIAPNPTLVNALYQNLLGGVLSGTGTILSQFSRLSAVLNPFQNAYQFMALAGGRPMRNPATFARVWGQYLKEIWKTAEAVPVGMQGVLGGQTYGLGVSQSDLATFRPREQSIARLKPSELWKFKVGRADWVKAVLGFEPTTQFGRRLKNTLLFPSWMASRSFPLIRGAEAWTGSIDRNMTARALMVKALTDKGESFQGAYNKVADKFNPKTNKVMWDEAMAQAQKDIDVGLVPKGLKRQRAEEVMQDRLDEEFGANLKNRHRQLSAWLNFKDDPITPVGNWFAKDVMGKAPTLMKSVFLFSRFFSNIIERAIFNSPLGFIHLTKEQAAKGAQTELQKRIEGMFGSLENYRQYRNGLASSSLVSTFAMTMATALAWAFWKWSDDDDESKPPVFWITGATPPTSPYATGRQLAAAGWWQPSSLVINMPWMERPLLVNYVQLNPELGITLNAIGNVADRVMFPELLNYSVDARTGEREFSPFKATVQPFVNALVAPATRSTYASTQAAIQRLFEGDPKGMAKLLSRPLGEVASATVLGGPGVRDLRKAAMPETPNAAQDWKQAIASGVPFADLVGLDTGTPMLNQFGEAVSPFSHFPFFNEVQESSESVKNAAKVLNDSGITKTTPQEWALGGDVYEIALNGERVILDKQERGEVLSDIGYRFARAINQNERRIRGAQEFKDKQKIVQELLREARGDVLKLWRSKIKQED